MIIGYLRVSTGKQHIENQKEEIQKFAARRNLKIDKWVTEVVSGKKNEHDRKLGKLLKSLRKGDVLIVTELSRLSRTLLNIMSILHRCLEKEIIIYSTKDGYAFDNSINSKVLAFAFALVAEIEHNLISMRTKEALAHRKSEGVRLGRPLGAIKQQVILENREEIHRLLKSGVSVSAICRMYNVSRETFYTVNRKHPLI
ncbi:MULTISPECIES: recombinase family protein [unclassified Butyricimonas]|uniref:recombinase family protein n=1 Tax=unclassified Butyricimonas TaxID=2637652 RepID=UPI000C074F6F|nr:MULTISPECIES: recombinase family protein [unclassified Butyricimonas]